VADGREDRLYDAIVVGTDGSATAGEAVRHAAWLAKATGATLHVVHAFKLVPTMPAFGPDSDIVAAPKGLTDAVETDAKAVLADAVATARAEGARTEGRLCRDDAANALVETAEQLGASLVVVGNKGMSGVKRFVLGSVPNKVSHHCACSLLIVHTSG
jgi:nucleotide-binding universal stress UspA family protein